MKKVEVPRSWTTNGAASFARDINKDKSAEDLVIDFRPTYFVRPFGTLVVGEVLRQMLKDRRSKGLKTKIMGGKLIERSSDNALSYLKHVGFFKFAKMRYGNKPGEAPGSNTYIPIELIEFSELTSIPEDKKTQDTIKRECDKLAGVLVKNEASKIMISYCFQEAIRNVYEHSGAGYCVVMAQKYASKKMVEIAILDTGKGVFESLKKSHDIESSVEAIEKTILPGISSSLDEESDDKWANSGFGLFVLSELGRELGEFELCSSGKVLSVTENSESSSDFQFSGTGIRLLVSYAESDYFPNLLESIVKRGEEDIFQRTGKRVKASMSTFGLWD